MPSPLFIRYLVPNAIKYLVPFCILLVGGFSCAETHTRGIVRSVQPDAADFGDLVAAVARGEFNRGAAIFAALERRWSRYAPHEQALLRGLAALELGRSADAYALLAGVRDRFPHLQDYLLYHLGEAALADSRSDVAIEVFSALLQRSPHGRWVDAARTKLVQAYIVAERWREVDTMLEAMEREARSPMAHRQAQLLRAAQAAAQGDRGRANAIYLTLYAEATSPSDLVAVKDAMQTFRDRFGHEPLAAFGADRRRELAADFLTRGLTDEAVRLLEGARASAAPSEELGQAYFGARRYREAAEQLCGVLDRGAAAMDALELLRLCATALARADRTEEAITRNRQVQAVAPGTMTAAIAQGKIAFLLAEAGKYRDAIAAYRAWLAMSPRGNGSVAEARWAIAWSHYQLKEWDAALEALDELAAEGNGNALWRDRIAYWQARILEAQGKREPARALYAAFAGDTSYYSWLARARLKGEERFANDDQRHSGRWGESTADWPTPAARELAHLGLWEWAVDEAARVQPGAYRFAVDRLGERWGVAPTLAYAVIRKESNFRPDIVSRAGAIGLMQLIPPTAARLARELHWRDFTEAVLYRPAANVRLGLWYLRSLLLRFDGALPLVLAGYNAGEDAADRWVAAYWRRRGKDDGHTTPGSMDEFIEEIPYDETNDYVKRVLTYYWGDVSHSTTN